MARNGVTAEQYQGLVEAFRLDPGNASHASRKTGVSRVTCKRAWELGWPKEKQSPIQQLLTDERIAARAALASEREKNRRLQEQEKEIARQEAIAALKEEGIVCNLARGTSIANLAALADMGEGIRKLSEQVNEALKSGVAGKDPAKALHLLWKFSASLRLAAESAHKSMEMERLRMGKPEDLLNPEDLEKAEITPDELEAEIAKGQRALSSVRERFTVLQGGAATEPAKE